MGLFSLLKKQRKDRVEDPKITQATPIILITTTREGMATIIMEGTPKIIILLLVRITTGMGQEPATEITPITLPCRHRWEELKDSILSTLLSLRSRMLSKIKECLEDLEKCLDSVKRISSSISKKVIN